MSDVLGLSNDKVSFGSTYRRLGLTPKRGLPNRVYKKAVPTGRPGQARSEGRTNRNNQSLRDAIRYGSNSRRWDRVADKVGVGNRRNNRDISRMVQYVTSGGALDRTRRNGNGGDGGSDSRADRSSGEFNDIRAALREDQQLGQETAADLQEKDVAVGGWPSELDDLLIKQQEAYDQQIAELQAGFENTLGGIGGQMTDMQAGYEAALGGLNNQLAAADTAYNQAADFMSAQLEAANAAAEAAEQRAANMRNAFVPQANPTALSVSYGDQRTTARKKANNQLSDLTILNGLGTTSNPLAGLQLA